MEGEHVGISGFREVSADAIDDGVGHFVGDDVLRETGKNELAGKIPALTGLIGLEVAKQNAVGLRAVISVRLLHRVRDRA